MNILAEPLYATLLVLVVTNTRVILAADSRKNTLYPDGSRQAGTMDKIFRTGDCYYAVSGFNATADGAFSLPAVIHKVLTLYPGFGKAIKRIATAVATELKAYLASLKKESPELFAQLLRDSYSGGEIVLVARVAGVPTAVLLTYRVIADTGVKVVVDSWSIDTGSIRGREDCFWSAIGHTGFLSKGLPAVKEVAHDPAGTAKRIIEEGAKKLPRLVGGPINMVELTREGVQWIEKSPTAPARF